MLKFLMVNGLWTPWKFEEDRRPGRVLTPCVGVMDGIIKVASSKTWIVPKNYWALTRRTGVIHLPQVIVYCPHDGTVAENETGSEKDI